jgi:hypothetical protein
MNGENCVLIEWKLLEKIAEYYVDNHNVMYNKSSLNSY